MGFTGKKSNKAIRRGNVDPDFRRFSSGIVGLDIALGHPQGILGGSIIQINGAESSGKSSLALSFIATAQKTGTLPEVEVEDQSTGEIYTVNAVLVDHESSYTKEYAESIGVDTDKLAVIWTDTIEEALDITAGFLTDGIQIVVVDSVAAGLTKAELEKDFTDNEKLGELAKVNQRLLRKFTILTRMTGAFVILINQFRSKVSTMPNAPDKQAAGGWAMRYFSKITIELVRVSNNDKLTKIELFVKKNKVGGKERERLALTYEFGVGIRKDFALIEEAKELDIVRPSGNWLYYGDIKANGMSQAAELFPLEEIEQKVIQYALLREGREEPTTTGED